MVSIHKTFLRMVKALATPNKMNNKMRPFTVIIEGNIGSGKTTFLNHFKKYDDVCVLAEPIEMWRNCEGHNLFAHMYQDTQKWGFTFQSYVQLTMLQHHKKVTPHPIKLMERSIFSARYCFVEKMAQDGLIPAPSASVLNEWFKWVIANTNLTVDLIVYLRTTPEVVYQRIMERNRQEEKTISLDYLKSLHEMHEDWLYHKKSFKCPAPVITLNADLDKSTILEEYEKFEPRILNKIGLSV